MKPSLVYVIHSLSPGGTERLAIDMALHFSEKFSVTLVCLDGPGEWANLLRNRGIQVTALWRQSGIDFGLAYRLAHLLKKLNADIVHAHQSTAWFYCGLAMWLGIRARLIFEEHGRFFPESDSILRRLVNKLLVIPKTCRNIAVSQDVKVRVARYEGVPSKNIDVIFNGCARPSILTAQKRASMRAAIGVSEGDFLVGSVGRLDPIKNYSLFIAAIARCANIIPRLKGVVVGEGGARAELEEFIADLGVNERFQLLGHQDNASEWTQCFDLFVLPSFSEGTSMALLEAMASGVAVLVTDVGGNPELVVENRGGWVVPSDDLEIFAEALADAGQSSEQRAEYARFSQRRFADIFTKDRMLREYERLYTEVL